MRFFSLICTLFLLAVLGCTGATGPQGLRGEKGVDGRDGRDGISGTNGADGKDGSSCTVVDNQDGTYTVSCTDGTSVTLRDGQDGTDGKDGADGQDGEDGQDGANGQNAPNIVSRTSEEPTGTNCELGGTKLEFGLDNNPTNGVLDDAEVTGSPVYICDDIAAADSCGTLEGNVVIRNTLDLLMVKTLGCTRITGNLTIQTSAVSSVLGLFALTQVDGDVQITSDDLQFVSLPALRTIGGSLTVSGLGKLHTLDLGALETVGHNLSVEVNPLLQTLDLRALRQVGTLNLRGIGRATAIDLPELRTVTSSFMFIDNARVTVMRANKLGTVGGTLFVNANPVLANLELAVITGAGSFDVVSNQQLPQCQVTRIRARLPAGIPYSASGNNTTATCQ